MVDNHDPYYLVITPVRPGSTAVARSPHERAALPWEMSPSSKENHVHLAPGNRPGTQRRLLDGVRRR